MQRFKLVLIATVALVVTVLLMLATYAAGERQPAPAMKLTPIPGIKATLTALPLAPNMPAAQARPYQALRSLVEICSAYSEARKIAVLNQIDYVLSPSTVPRDFVVMYGDAWRGRMIYGSAYLTALEWKLQGEDKSSCLYHIGASFNALLPGLGEQTLPEFP
jgi:hypothetical protein